MLVLLLTARVAVGDRLKGFAAADDDYVVKPFSMRELMARVHALLRRRGSEEARGSTGRRTDSPGRQSCTRPACRSTWRGVRSCGTAVSLHCRAKSLTCFRCWSRTGGGRSTARPCSRAYGARTPMSKTGPSTSTSAGSDTNFTARGRGLNHDTVLHSPGPGLLGLISELESY